MRRTLGAGALAVVVVLALVRVLVDDPGTSATDGPSTSTTTVTTGSTTAARAELARLVVATPDPGLAEYRRAAFGDGWAYDPTSGCNTRERVLIAESQVPATVGARCHPTAGRWRSAYDGVVATDPTALEIDHLVPLADAWRAGAAHWTPARREAYANDLADPNVLAAVTTHANRSKSDRTPDEWLPPDPAARCAYAADWVEVKGRWNLTVTAPERGALEAILNRC